jgi:EmrB/QacA subfamily drug resistance transporter
LKYGDIIQIVGNTKDMPVNKTILLLVTSLATFSSTLLSMAVSVALPSIGRAFAMEAHLLGWVSMSFVIAAAAAMIPIGRLADIYGRNRIFTYGLVLFIISSILCAVAPSATVLIFSRVVQGIGASMIWGPAIALLSSAVSVEERGRAIGINTTAAYIGLSVGPFWGGFLTDTLGWHSIFYFGAIVALLAAILAFWKLGGHFTESKAGKMDFGGAAALVISLLFILYGFSTLPGLSGTLFIVAGLIVMFAFYRIEQKAANPVLNVNLFSHNRAFVFILVAIICLYCATFATNFLLSLYLQYNKGLTATMAGAILVLQPVMMAILAPFSGRLSDKIDPVKVSLLGMGVTCIGLILFSLLSDGSPLWYVFISLIVFGTGFGLFASPATNAVMSSIDKKFFGVASGIVAALRHGGQAISMAIVMILFTIYIGDAQITPQHYAAFLVSQKIGFIIFIAICLGGMAALVASGRSGSSTGKQ